MYIYFFFAPSPPFGEMLDHASIISLLGRSPLKMSAGLRYTS